MEEVYRASRHEAPPRRVESWEMDTSVDRWEFQGASNKTKETQIDAS